MKLRNALLAAVSVASITAVALAYQLAVRVDPLNIAVSRLAGSWTLEPTITGRLDPNRTAKTHTSFKFVEDLNIIQYMQSGSDRFKDLRIYSAGQVVVDGENATHPYLVFAENGNMKLQWYSPNNDNPIGSFETKALQIAVARDAKLDILILGGDTRGETSTAYIH